ncbi:MAG TPA: J domain-containing protein [Candidatus Nanoarchaeia archaeon]|nr:J domain-containing protein [Candidatus Nanoarchaeia archaeon]
MITIKVKGHEFEEYIVKDSFSRRAVQLRNNIIHTLKKLGLTENHMEVELEPSAFKKAPASAHWYFNGRNMYYSYDSSDKFVDNLYVVSKVLELEVEAVISESKPVNEFVDAFSEEEDVEEQRKKARTALGLDHEVKDLDLINQTYKKLARAHHPDTPTGNVEKFKAINHAHKVLKRELE